MRKKKNIWIHFKNIWIHFFSANDVDDDHVEMSNVSPAFAGDGLFSPKASITTKKEEEVEDETSIPNRVGEEDKIDEIEQIHI